MVIAESSSCEAGVFHELQHSRQCFTQGAAECPGVNFLRVDLGRNSDMARAPRR